MTTRYFTGGSALRILVDIQRQQRNGANIMITTQILLMSSTGMVHLGNGNGADCNGRSGSYSRITIGSAEKKDNSMFCKKCFCNHADKKGLLVKLVDGGYVI